MDPSETIAEIAQAHGGPCALDRVHLPYAHSSSGPAAKFGLGCQLFLTDTDPASLRERSLQVLGDYYRLFPARVGEFLPEDHRRTVKLKGDPTERIRADSRKFPFDRGYSTSLFGAVDIGLPKDDVCPYQAHMLAVEAQSGELSFVSATMPVGDDAGEPNFRILLPAVLRWCELARPVHGSAGFTFIFASGMSQNTVYALPLMKRFPGFDIHNGVDFISRADGTHNRIKCINWLTVLCDDLVAELGGVERMRHALAPACTIHGYAGGVMIQAGEEPRLGDSQRGDVPEPYRMVARYTKPVRFENYVKYGLFRVANGLDRVAETLAWIRRFD